MKLAQQAQIASLANGLDSVFIAGVRRRTAEIMEADLRNPNNVLKYDYLHDNRGLTGPTLWRIRSQELAAKVLDRPKLSADDFARKNQEYIDLATRIRGLAALPQLFTDRQNGITYLVEENDKVRSVLKDIVESLAAWVMEHSSDEDFLKTSSYVGLFRLLDERPDLLAALRFSQTLPKDVTVSRVAIDRPAIVEVVEVVIGCIPVLGNAVAVVEAVSGQDLFGYELDALDRATLAAGTLLPAAARLVKRGRVLYTAARLERLYGSKAERWSIALASGERVAIDGDARRVISEANAVTKAHSKLSTQIATDVVKTLDRLGLKNARAPRFSQLPEYVSTALKNLVSQKAFLTDLDEFALQRVIDKGPSVNKMKGQLLEELLETKIAGWIRDKAGMAALGIERPPEGIHFVPGHLIRDANGRQITDGVLARRFGDVLEIVAIFEAKSGASAARELKLSSSSISGLTRAERAELRAEAREELLERAEQARRLGKDFPTATEKVNAMLDDIEKEIILSERDGQVTRDIERLYENEDGTPTTILVGTEETKVRISPTKTKVFAVIPNNVRVGSMEADLKASGYNFEVLGMNVTDKELTDLSKTLSPLVTSQ